MRRRMVLLAAAAMAVFVMTAAEKANKPGEGSGRRPSGPPPGGPPGFELGRVLPPHIRGELNLTTEQEKEIADLEKEVKGRLEKILTDDQKNKIKTMGPPPPPQDHRPTLPPARVAIDRRLLRESGNRPAPPEKP